MTALRGLDPTVDFMVRNNLPLTREAYLRIRFDDPSALSAEEKASVPALFREPLEGLSLPEPRKGRELAEDA